MVYQNKKNIKVYVLDYYKMKVQSTNCDSRINDTSSNNRKIDEIWTRLLD